MAAPTFQAAGTAASGTAAISVSWPTHTTDDVGILLVATENQAVATPSGWNTTGLPAAQGNGTAGNLAAARLTAFWRRAQSAGESAATAADPGTVWHGRIFTFRGCIGAGSNQATSPIDVSAGTNAAASTSVTFPSVTTTDIDRLIVLALADSTDSTTTSRLSGTSNGSLSGITERGESGTTSAGGAGICCVTATKATAGSTGTTSATASGSTAQGRMTIALMSDPPAETNGTITVQSFGSFSNAGTTGTTQSASIPIAAAAGGVDRRLVVQVGSEHTTGDGASVSSITCNGTALEIAQEDQFVSGADVFLGIYHLRESDFPANGSRTLQVNFSTAAEYSIDWVIYEGIDDGVNPTVGTPQQSGGATSLTESIAVSDTDSLYTAVSYKNNAGGFSAITVDSDPATTSSSIDLSVGGANISSAHRLLTTETGSIDVTFTQGSSQRQSLIGAVFAPTASSVDGTLAMTGVPFTGSGAGTAAGSGGTPGPAPTFVDWDHDLAQGGPQTQVVAAMPPLAAVGDYIIAFITTTQDGTPQTPTTNGVPWTFLGSTTTGATSSTPECAAYGRFKIPGDPSTVTFTNALGSGSGYGLTSQTLAFNGVDPTTPIDVSATTSNGAGAPPDPASITTVTTNCMVVVCGFMDGDAGTLVVSSGYTNPIGTNDANSGGGSDNGSRSSVCYKALSSAGAENPGVFTTNTNDEHGAITIALRPVISGGGSVDGDAALTGVPFTGSGSGTAKIEATAALTGVPFTGSGSGVAKIASTLALTGVPFTGSGVGVAKIEAAAALTGVPFTGSGVGVAKVASTLALTGVPFTGSGVGVAKVEGTLALTGVPFTGSGVGRGHFAGTLALAGVPFQGSGVGVHSVLGTLALTGVPFTGSGTGQAKVAATAALTGVPFTGSGVGVAAVAATAALTGVPFTGSGTGVAKVAATLATTGVPFTGSGTGTASIQGALSLTGVPFAGSGTGIAKVEGTLGLTGVPFTGSGVGRGHFAGDLPLTGVPFTGSGVGTASNNPTANLPLTGIPFSGTGVGQAKVEATLAVTGVPFTGSGVGLHSARATLALTGVPFAGSGIGVASYRARLDLVNVPFTGSGVGLHSARATLGLTGVPFSGAGAGQASFRGALDVTGVPFTGSGVGAAKLQAALGLVGVPFTGSGVGSAINLYEAFLELRGVPFTGSGVGRASLATVDDSVEVTIGGPELVVDEPRGADLVVAIAGATAIVAMAVVAAAVDVTVAGADVIVVVEEQDGD